MSRVALPRERLAEAFLFPPICVITGETERLGYRSWRLDATPRWSSAVATPLVLLLFYGALRGVVPNNVLGASFAIMVTRHLWRRRTAVKLIFPLSRRALSDLRRRRLVLLPFVLLVASAVFLAQDAARRHGDPVLELGVALLLVFVGYGFLALARPRAFPRIAAAESHAIQLELPNEVVAEALRASLDGRNVIAAPAGAHCSKHPGDSAAFVCSRCGAFGCTPCGKKGVCVECWRLAFSL